VLIRAEQQAVLAQDLGLRTLAAGLHRRGLRCSSGSVPGELIVEDRRGKRSRLHLDGHGQLARVVSPLGRAHEFAYDTQQRLAQLRDPRGSVLALAYDDAGRLVSAVRDTSQQWRLDWDQRSNLRRLELPDRSSIRTDHTTVRQVVSHARGDDPPVELVRDERGVATALIEGTGARTEFEYGAWETPDRVIRADGSVEEVERDQNGKVIEARVDGTPWFSANYDDAGRLARVDYADGHFVSFVYDGDGRLLQAENAESIVKLSYDEQGRLVGEEQNGQLVRYAHDAAGLLTAIATPTGEGVRFAYDDDARLSEIEDWTAQRHQLQYDVSGRIERHIHPNGVVRDAHLTAAGLPSELRTYTAQGQLSVRLEYTRNDQLQVEQDSTRGARQFAYDASGRLSALHDPAHQVSELFGYDGSGNRLAAPSGAARFNAVNQLIESGSCACSYDARGNLIEETRPEGTTRYRYNGQNLLVEVELPDGEMIRYGYDAFARRIRKTSSQGETRYLWAVDQLLREVEVHGERTEQRDYLFLPGTQTPISMRVNGATYQYHNDHKGAPRWLTDARGAIAWSATLSAFGTAHITHESVRQPFRFPGQYHDRDTGLHYNRARYYSPEHGRYLSRDPLDLIGGINAYVYAGNDPINGTDPLGMFSWGAAAVFTAGIAVGAVICAVALPAIAISAAGLAAAGLVVGGAALVGGSVAGLATDITTDGCVPCMLNAFEKGALAGAQVGLDVALLVMSGGLSGPFAGGGALAVGNVAALAGAALVAMGTTATTISILMTSGGPTGSGDGEGKGDKTDPAEAEKQRRAEIKRKRDLQSRSSRGDKDATRELNEIRARDARKIGLESTAEGYEAENKVIEAEGDNVVEAGREVEYPNPNDPSRPYASDIDVETKSHVVQVKSGTSPPSSTQTEATRLRAAEVGKSPRLVYDPAKMNPGRLADFQAQNPDFECVPMSLR
jgi:RHS repeat-associated protein